MPQLGTDSFSAPGAGARGANAPGAAAGALGLPRVHFRLTDSTNARARELAAGGAPHGTVVSAAEQTAGRGRQGRTWSAPAGRALLCSLVLRHLPRLLPLAAGVAVAETCEALGSPAALVKWPNDVLIEGRKVAGILVEGRPQEGWAVVGIGLNVAIAPEQFPPELRQSAGTLGLQPRPESLEHALEELLARLGAWSSPERPEPEVLEAVRARDALRGQAVSWAHGGGIGEGIDADGRLLVRGADGALTALDAGEVHLRR
jgi:BirA family biotin operon repressor/biotin-[acetyl-CoA-carboxylase] ligase